MKIALVIFITLALAGCALLSLHMGVIPVPWRALLTDWQAGREHYYVLMEYRLPRLLLALFVGAALAVAGVLIQGIVRNPLASPDNGKRTCYGARHTRRGDDPRIAENSIQRGSGNTPRAGIWQADVPNEVDCTGRKNQTTTE